MLNSVDENGKTRVGCPYYMRPRHTITASGGKMSQLFSSGRR